MDGLRRGSIVSLDGAGETHLAMVVQADVLLPLPHVAVLRLTADLVDAPLLRITLPASPENGLRTVSQVMVDKAVTVPKDRIGGIIGQIEPDRLREVNRAMMRFFDLAG
jgi:mRNA interferase MazF